MVTDGCMRLNKNLGANSDNELKNSIKFAKIK